MTPSEWMRAQARLGVPVDGDDGPTTWGALVGYAAQRQGAEACLARGRSLARHAELQTPARVADFLANTAHESGNYTRGRELMSYTSAARIREMWRTRFPTVASAQPYVRQPEKLANFVYARPREGNTQPGDGWRFRGGGDIQVTFRNGYRAASADVGFDLEASPERIIEPGPAILTALGYYRRNGLWALVDAGRTTACRARLNTGNADTPRSRINGMDDVDLRRGRILRLFG